MKRRLATALVAGITSLGVVAPTVLTAAPAQAAGSKCVNKKEYRKVHRGDSKAKVKRIFDSKGQLILQGYGSEYREWNTCGSKWGFVTVDFERRGGVKRVTGKSAYWG